jgi:hypothetical protein
MGVLTAAENIANAAYCLLNPGSSRCNDSFADGNGNNTNNGIEKRNPLVYLIVVVLFLIVHLLVSKWLWNNILVKLVSVAKPADNVWQLLGLTLLFGLLGGN